MQSNQSRLLIAGIVATHVGATQIETNENTLSAYQQDYKNLLAQTKEPDDNIPAPAGNSNTDSEANAASSAAENPLVDDTTDGAADSDLVDKLELISDAALGGLVANSEWYIEKLENFADEKKALFDQMDETCRIKLDDTYNTSRQSLEDGAAAAMATMRECRMTYVEAVLAKKEELKGELQNMLNQAIQELKELKAGQELNEAGLPTADHSNEIEDKITMVTDDFTAAVTTFVADNFETFFANTAGTKMTFDSCLTGAEATFGEVFTDTEEVPATGASDLVNSIYAECQAELDAFNTKVIDVLDEQIADYVEDARNQKNVVATDFANVLESTLFKIHEGLSDLDSTELGYINTAIATERDNMETDVGAWFTQFMMDAEQISTDLMGELDGKAGTFMTDIDTTLKGALADFNEDLMQLVNAKLMDEDMLADAQTAEMTTWLTSHVTDLEEALAEVCTQEHAYNYNPPGFFIDSTVADLAVFKKLSEKFELMVVQLVGTFSTFVEQINGKMARLKEQEKARLTVKRLTAERSLTMATGAFGDGIKYVRESVEMKAGMDQTTIETAARAAREIIAYQLEQKKNNLWRSISYLAKKLYANEREDYNNEIKTQILAKFKEFKEVIVDATTELHESQSEKWLEYQEAIAEYYTFFDKKVIGAKQSMFETAQALLVKKLKSILQKADSETGGALDDYEHKVFKQLHQNREIMINLYNNAIASIDNIDDPYLTTPLVEVLNGHKEEADYEFDYREDMFLDDFIVVREWWTDFLEEELFAFQEHVVLEAGNADENVREEKQSLVQWTTQKKQEMKEFFQEENESFKQTVDEFINRFKWLLTKYGMDAKLPTEDDLLILSPDPFTGALNAIDAGRHKEQHENGEPHSLPGDAPHYDEQADPLANLPGKPVVPRGEGLKPKTLLESDPVKDDGHDTPHHEHTTPHIEEELHHDEVESVDDEQVQAEVEGVLASSSGPVTDTGLGIDDEDLKKKIVDTVEFFLGKLPATSTELVKALHIRREELSAIIDHVRGGLTEALEAEFATAWATLQEFLDKLNYALKERDTAALGAVSGAVDEFLHDVAELRAATEAACKALKEKLSYGLDEHEAHKLEAAILAEKDAFEAGIDEALTNMEIVVGDMQTAQDTAFGNARQALANALNGKRTAFDNSLQRDAATFQDALDHNYAAFTESVNTQRTAFEDALAEKQATFDAAKARKLQQIHFVHDSNYKFNLIKLLEAKSAAITEAIGQARRAFTEALNVQYKEFESFRQVQRDDFDALRAKLRDNFAQAEVDAEATLNAEIEVDNEAFDTALEEASAQLEAGLNEQREALKAYLAQAVVLSQEEYTYTEHVAPTQTYSPYSHSAHTTFLNQFHYYLSDQLKKLDAGIDGIAEWTQKEVDAAMEAFGTAVGYSEQRLGDQRLMGQEALAQLADTLATEYAEAQDLELDAIKEKRSGLEEAVAAKAEELKKKIIYLKKQLHYVGSATAAEEYKLEDAIIALVGEFDAAVAEVRAWITNNIQTELGESTARANAVGEAFGEATGRLMEIQAALSAELAQAARDGATSTEKEFVTTSQERLDAFNHVINALTEKVQHWYEEKLAWIAQLDDQEYYAKELKEKLTAKKDQALAALADRSAAAQEVANYRREELGARLGELIVKYDNSANFELQTLADSSGFEASNLASDVQTTNDGFATAANFELNGLNAFLDDLMRQWAWWLKQYYGYVEYDAALYEGYVEEEAGQQVIVEDTVYSEAPAHESAAGPGAHTHHAVHAEPQLPVTAPVHNPALDARRPASVGPESLPGFDEIEAFLNRDFLEDLPATSEHLLSGLDVAASELEKFYDTYEDNARDTLESRREELQGRLVLERQTIEDGLAAAAVESKDHVRTAREALAADVAQKRALVVEAIDALKHAHYPSEEDQRELLHEIHEAKEAFATAVQDARADFDALLVKSRESSESRFASARSNFDSDLTRKRSDLDGAIGTLRVQLKDVAASKREALSLVMKAAWADLEQAIAEKVHAFHYAVEAKLSWINQIHYYDIRSGLIEAVKQLQATFVNNIVGLKQVFADAAESRRLAADAFITAQQEGFETTTVEVLTTCDGNRAAESGFLEATISDIRTSFDEQLTECRGAIGEAIDHEIHALKSYLQGTYGYQGHKPGSYAARPAEPTYFDDEAQDAVQEYIDHVTQPQTVQASGAIEWLGQRKENEKAASVALRDEIVGAQNDRATHEADAFGETVDGLIMQNADLAASLLSDIQAKSDAIQGSLEQLKHEHWSYVDVHGYRYKLLKQLHHQREAFEQAVDAAWLTWTQSRELAVQNAAAGAAQSAESFEAFLATELGKWEADAAATRADVAGAIGAKGDALKGSVQEAARAFAEKQIYKRKFIETVEDAYKAKALTAKVDLEDKVFQQSVKAIWTSFTSEAQSIEDWLNTFLSGESDGLAASQDAIGAALADALADKLDALGNALGELGDSFSQSKSEEIERVMQALYGYGYDGYKPNYVPVLKKKAEVIVQKPVIVRPIVIAQPQVIQVPAHAHAHAHGHAHAHPVHVHKKPEVIPVAVAPAPVVVEEPSEESLSEVSEAVEVVGEVFHGDAEDPYVDYDVVVEESESSEHTHESVDHYAAAAPEESSEETVVELVQPDPTTAPKVVATKVGGRVYRPEHALVAHSAAYRRPAAYHHHPVVAPVAPVLVHDHDSSDDEPNVTINIYNGNGATMGFGANLECVPRVGECRPQCPEVVYNEYDNSLWFTWQEDTVNCPSGSPENTFLTLYSPVDIGKEVAEDLGQNLVREVEGTAVPEGGLQFAVKDVFANGRALACDQSYFVSGMYTWHGKTGKTVYGMPETSPNSIWIPCAHPY